MLPASNAAFLKGFATGQTLAQIQAADPNFTPPSFQTPANTMHSPQYQKWSLQAQQSFGASTSLTIGYFGNHGIHELVQNPNANAFGFGSYSRAEVQQSAGSALRGSAIRPGHRVRDQCRFQLQRHGRFLRTTIYPVGQRLVSGQLHLRTRAGRSLQRGSWRNLLIGSSVFPTGCQQSSRKLRGSGLRCAPFLQRKLRLGSSGQRGATWTRPGLSGEGMAALGNDLRPHRFSLHGD